MEDKYKDDRASLWEEVQKKTFCGWINMHLSTRNMRVNNLEEDFCDGVKLITLLEILHGKKIEGRYYKNPKSKPYKIDNVNFALNFITDNLKIKLISCSAEDIVDGNVKIILGMCWRLIQKFQLTHDNSRQTLLAWVKEITGLEVENFQSSFQDGVIFCALVHKFDPSLFPMDTIKHENKAENLNRAFNLAEEHMDIPQLLDAEDMIKGLVDERSLMTYVSLINRAFEQKNAPIIRYNANLEVKAKESKSEDHSAPVDDVRSQLQKENEKLLKELESMKKDYEDEKRLRLELETEQIILKNLVNKQNEEKQAKLDKIPDIESSDDEDDASDDEEKHKQKPSVEAVVAVVASQAENKEAAPQDDQKQPEVVEQSKELAEEKKEDEKKGEEKKEDEKKEEKKEDDKKEEVQLVEEKKDEHKDDSQKDDGLRKKKKDTKRKTERRKSSRANKDSLLDNSKDSEKKSSANNEETQKLLATKDKRIEELEKEVSDTRNKLREQSKVSETLQKSLEDTREEIGLIQKRHKKAQDKDTKRIQKRLEKRLQRREKELETLKLNYETELKKKDDEIETLKGQLKKTQAALGSSKEDLPSESDQLADVEFLKAEYQSLLPIIFNFEEEEKTLALRASKPKLDAPDEPDEDK